MSLRPGSRWTPSTQGITGGIGSAFAGVSDQIRRVMQDRPASSAPALPPTVAGVVTSGPISLAVGGGGWAASWQVPSLSGTVAAYSVYVTVGPGGATGVSVFTVGAGGSGLRSQPRPLNDGWSADEITYPTSAVTTLAVVVGTADPVSGGTAVFQVVSW